MTTLKNIELLTQDDLKKYVHFDKKISLKLANELVAEREFVCKYRFYPFMLYKQEWTSFRKNHNLNKKVRPIRYAARLDAYIFTTYRKKLAEKYESLLSEHDLHNSVLAYRRVLTNSGKGKNNIHFAKEAFDKIDELDSCLVIALDIASFFENLSHKKIKEMWCRLLNVRSLPDDHYTVYKNITRYHYVDRNEVYKRLGCLEENEGRLKRTAKSFPLSGQLCDEYEFREKVCGRGLEESLILSNDGKRGVPQGAALSDLIANFYLFDFDLNIKEFIAKKGGSYMRYSDDILILLPSSSEDCTLLLNETEAMVQTLLNEFGDAALTIKDEKVEVVYFSSSSFKWIKGKKATNGIEYLGFRYDGKKAYIRNSTISRLYRKVSSAVKVAVLQHVEKYPEQNESELKASFDYDNFFQSFLRKRFEYLDFNNPRTWNFYSYLKKAKKIMEYKGVQIPKQIYGVSKFIQKRVDFEVSRRKT